MKLPESISRICCGLVLWATVVSSARAGENRLRPIQRIELPADRVAAEMNRLEQGVLVRLSRAEFERLVRQAGQAASALDDTPRLVEARYKATLQGDGLAGTAEWRLIWNHPLPGRFPLDSLSLAIRSAQWSDETPALLGNVDRDNTRSLALLVPGPGERRLKWDWSARGVADPHGLRVDFRVPDSLMTSLELDLPADHTIHVEREGAIVSGTTTGVDAARRLWRVTFPRSGGASGARLVFRRPPFPDQPPPVIRVQTTSIQRLSPGHFEGEYQFDIRVSRGDIRQLAIDLDPAIRPLELSCPEADSWTVTPQSDGRSRLALTLRSAMRQGRISLRTVAAPPAADQLWISPAATLAGALTDMERLIVSLHPELRLDQWSAGTFSPVAPPPDPQGWTVLALQATSANGSRDHRPRGLVRVVPRSLRTRETWECHVLPDRVEMWGDILVVPPRGAGVGQTWEIPSGWEVDEVIARAGDPEVSWEVSPTSSTTGSRLQVIPLRDRASAGTDRYSIRLRTTNVNWVHGPAGETAQLVLRMPQLRDSQSRDGSLTVKLDPSLTHEPFGSTLEPEVPSSFRGSMEARIQLRRRADRFRVQLASRITLGERQLRAVHVWTLNVPDAAVRQLMILTPSTLRFMSWRVIAGSVRLRAVEPLLGPGIFGFQLWRVVADRPFKGLVSVEWAVEPSPLLDEPIISVPLPVPLGVEVIEATALVRLFPGSPWHIESDGMIERRADSSDVDWPERLVNLGSRRRLRFVRETMSARPARVAQAELTTRLDRSGTTTCQARFVLGAWVERELPIRLPAQAEVASIRLGQRPWHIDHHTADASGWLRLPWNPGRDWESVEIVYRLPGPTPRAWTQVRSQPPELPVEAEWTCSWQWPARFIPILTGTTLAPHSTSVDGIDTLEEWVPLGASPPVVWLLDKTAVRLAALIGWSALVVLMLISPGGQRWLLGVGLFVLGAMIIWLPPPLLGASWVPLGAGVLLSLVFVIASLRRRHRGRMSARRSSPGRSLATLAGSMLGAGWIIGAPPQPAVVFLLPHAPGEEQSVLASPIFLGELKSWVEKAEVLAPMILEARLEGQASAREVRWIGRFTLHAASDKSLALPLRLGEAQLIAAELNDLPVFPEISSDRGVYEFRLPGRGTHLLTIHFSTLVSDRSDSETRFLLSEIPICSAIVDFPQGTSEMQFLTSRGIQKRDTGRNAPRLEADLGRLSAVHLRWRSATRSGEPTGTVESAHLWDISEHQARLLSVFRFRLGAGVMRRVEFDIPTPLELVDVVIRPVDDPLNLFGLTGPRDWRQSIQPNRTRHHLELAVPLSGQVQIELELVPRQMPAENWIVTVPEVVGSFDRQTSVGIRLAEQSMLVRSSQGWEAIAPADFLRRHWRPLRVDARDHEPATAFRRSNGFEPTIVINLKPQTKKTVQQRAQWRTGPGRASFQVVAHWSDMIGPGPLEWEIPTATTIHEVRGEGVTGWSRTGSVLQVWLAVARPEPVTVTLDGFLPVPAAATQPFELPPLTPVNAGPIRAEMVVESHDDWRISALETGAYRQYPTTELPGLRWAGFAEHPSTTVWALYPAGCRMSGDVVTAVEPLDREFAFRAVARTELNLLPQSDIATFWLEVRHGGSELPRLQLPPGHEIRDTRPIPGGTRWIIDAPPGPMSVSVVGRSPLDETPFVSLRPPAEPAPTVRHWLVTTPGLQLGKIAPAPAADQPPSDLLSAVRIPPDGTVWKIDRYDLDLTINTQTGMRQFWLEMQAAPNPRGWLVRLSGWLAVEPAASIISPGGVGFLSVQVNGHELTTLGGSTDRVSIPRGLSLVSIVWPTETLDFRPPQLMMSEETGPLTPVLVTIAWAGPGLLRPARPALDPVEVESRRQESFQDFLRQLGPGFPVPGAPSPRLPTLPPSDNQGGPYEMAFLRGDRFTWLWEGDGPPAISLPESSQPTLMPQILATLILALALTFLFAIRRS